MKISVYSKQYICAISGVLTSKHKYSVWSIYCIHIAICIVVCGVVFGEVFSAEYTISVWCAVCSVHCIVCGRACAVCGIACAESGARGGVGPHSTTTPMTRAESGEKLQYSPSNIPGNSLFTKEQLLAIGYWPVLLTPCN